MNKKGMKNSNSEKFESLEMRNIYKEFPGVIANNNINLLVKSGEVHALLGENGAGKTTLMNILYGIYQPDKGEIYLNSKYIEIRSPKDAISYKIGMVHQHFMLIPTHTVAENICLGLDGVSSLNPIRDAEQRISKFCDEFGLKINPKAKIWQLSAGEQQRVEIIKALLRGANLLILDEPTSVLTPQEAEELFKILEKMVLNGHSIIFITHKLDEVFEISHKVTVLRQGKVIGTLDTSITNKQELARMMVGREVIFSFSKPELPRGKKIVEIKDLSIEGDKGLTAVKSLNFEIYENEIFGIAGVSGNGQKELVEAITGLRKILKGKIEILGKSVENRNPRIIGELAVAHIPEERIKYGIVPNLPVFENSALRDYYHPPFSKGLIMEYGFIKNETYDLVREFSISTPSIETPVKLLSGGNIQKLILAREISTKSKFIVAAHPTYGLDIAATEFIRQLLLKKRSDGSAILLVSEDLEELLELSDRVGVMFMGEFMGIISPKNITIEDIGLMMAGTKKLI